MTSYPAPKAPTEPTEPTHYLVITYPSYVCFPHTSPRIPSKPTRLLDGHTTDPRSA